jgi:hypothetical protein
MLLTERMHSRTGQDGFALGVGRTTWSEVLVKFMPLKDVVSLPSDQVHGARRLRVSAKFNLGDMGEDVLASQLQEACQWPLSG